MMFGATFVGATGLGPHAGYILGAYAFTTLVVGGLIGHALRDHRRQKRALAGLQDGAGERP